MDTFIIRILYPKREGQCLFPTQDLPFNILWQDILAGLLWICIAEISQHGNVAKVSLKSVFPSRAEISPPHFLPYQHKRKNESGFLFNLSMLQTWH